MANVFNAAEIIDMGIEKEKKRRDFYGLVAKSFSQKDRRRCIKEVNDKHAQAQHQIKDMTLEFNALKERIKRQDALSSQPQIEASKKKTDNLRDEHKDLTGKYNIAQKSIKELTLKINQLEGALQRKELLLKQQEAMLKRGPRKAA